MSRRAKRKLPKRFHSSGLKSPKVSQSKPASRERWASIAVCIFLAVAVWTVFGQTLRFGFVDYDDDEYVYENPHIIHGLNLKAIHWAFTHAHGANWHPLTTLTHMLDCQVYGLHPWGHHLENVLVHGMAAILLFLLLQQMTGALWRSGFVAALFAVHPLHVESVAWVSERKDVLSGLFFMLTLMAYVRYARTKGCGPGLSFLGSPAYWGALLLFALGLMSKPMLVTLPFVLLLLDWWPLQRVTIRNARSTLGRLVWEKIPFLLLSAASCAATIWAQKEALNSLQRITFPARVCNAVVSYAAYLGQMLYPVDLAVYYPHPGNHMPLWTVGVSALVLLIVSAVVLAGGRKHSFLLVGWLWYLGMLVPVIGLVQVGGQARADRYTYLPQIGLYIMVAWAAVDLTSSWRYRRALLGSGAALALATLLVLAHIQTAYWENSFSLMTHTIACTPDNSLVHNNLGYALVAQGKLREAIQHYEQALHIRPGYPEAHNNLGVALADEGKLAEAVQHYERALQFKPDYAEAYNNLGSAVADQGKLDEAVHDCERALQLKPDYPEAHNNLGIVLARQGHVSEAIQHYERALQLKPDYAEAFDNLGMTLATQGKLPEAIQQYERALQLRPVFPEACNNLGLALAREGKLAEAIQEYERALQLRPDYVEVLNNLAFVLATSPDASLRNATKAIALSQQANQLTGGKNPVVLGTLAAAYAGAGRYTEAVEAVNRAIERADVEGKSKLVIALESVRELYQARAAGQ